MKAFLMILIFGASALVLFKSVKRNSTRSLSQTTTTSHLDNDIRVVFYQDVSKSNLKNGVQLISSSLFAPYYYEFGRNVEVNFGVIASSSANKLLTITLPKARLTKPFLPEVSKLSITERKKAKERFSDSLQQFKSDSTAYFSDRLKRFQEFCTAVDSLVDLYRNNLTSETDLITCLSVADKVFNYGSIQPAQSFLIFNSDGRDSHLRKVTKFRKDVAIVLSNASGKTSSIDAIITISLESPEQAIQYSLNHYSTKNQPL